MRRDLEAGRAAKKDLEAGRAAKRDPEAGKKVRRVLEAGGDMRDPEAGRVAKRHQEVGREDPNKVHMYDSGARSSSALFGTLFLIKKFYIWLSLKPIRPNKKEAFMSYSIIMISIITKMCNL